MDPQGGPLGYDSFSDVKFWLYSTPLWLQANWTHMSTNLLIVWRKKYIESIVAPEFVFFVFNHKIFMVFTIFFFKSLIRETIGPLVCVWCQEYRYNTMHLSLYHESQFIPWGIVYTMSTSQYHDSLSIPWVKGIQESDTILWVKVYTIGPSQYHESKSKP